MTLEETCFWSRVCCDYDDDVYNSRVPPPFFLFFLSLFSGVSHKGVSTPPPLSYVYVSVPRYIHTHIHTYILLFPPIFLIIVSCVKRKSLFLVFMAFEDI
ncbi:hypothetical protein F5X96DRAFT_655829 [Biscogniauxia mediterranea]|nr:hypothetical protein F5X96DRAFT_655829 [Biscogniauxia mediterranea]